MSIWTELGLESARAHTCQVAIPNDGAYALFLYGLVRMLGGNSIVEIGSYHGFSTIALRCAQIDAGILDPHLWVVEKDPTHVEQTRSKLTEAGLYPHPNVHLVTGAALDVAAEVVTHADLIIDDAGHETIETLANFDAYRDKLTNAGLFLFHDMAGVPRFRREMRVRYPDWNEMQFSYVAYQRKREEEVRE